MILPLVPLCWRDLLNPAVQVLMVIPIHELGHSLSCSFEVSKSLLGKPVGILHRAEQRFNVSIIIRHTGPRVRTADVLPAQHLDHGVGFRCGAVIAVQHWLATNGSNAFRQGCALGQHGFMVAVILFMHLPANNLAAIEIEDHIKVVPLALDQSRQIGQIPAPDLHRASGRMGGRWPLWPRLLGAASVSVMPLCSKDAVNGGFARHVATLISLGRHNLSRRQRRKPRLIDQG